MAEQSMISNHLFNHLFIKSSKVIDKVKYSEHLIEKFKFCKLRDIDGKIIKGSFNKNDLFSSINTYIREIHVRKNKKTISKQFYFEKSWNDYDDLSYLLKPIQKLAYDLFLSKGMSVKNSGQIFISSYNINNNIADPFDFHRDDSLGQGNVETCIFYIKKNKHIQGGDLNYINSNKEIINIPINENDYLLFNGNIYHKPTEMSGIGLRNAIVLQFQSYR